MSFNLECELDGVHRRLRMPDGVDKTFDIGLNAGRTLQQFKEAELHAGGYPQPYQSYKIYLVEGNQHTELSEDRQVSDYTSNLMHGNNYFFIMQTGYVTPPMFGINLK